MYLYVLSLKAQPGKARDAFALMREWAAHNNRVMPPAVPFQAYLEILGEVGTVHMTGGLESLADLERRLRWLDAPDAASQAMIGQANELLQMDTLVRKVLEG